MARSYRHIWLCHWKVTIRIVDRIAYLCHDFDDAQRAGWPLRGITFEVREYFGMTPSSMITAMLKIWCGESLDKPVISMSSDTDDHESIPSIYV